MGPEGWKVRKQHFETVTSLVRASRNLFPEGAAAEIWSEFRFGGFYLAYSARILLSPAESYFFGTALLFFLGYRLSLCYPPSDGPHSVWLVRITS